MLIVNQFDPQYPLVLISLNTAVSSLVRYVKYGCIAWQFRLIPSKSEISRVVTLYSIYQAPLNELNDTLQTWLLPKLGYFCMIFIHELVCIKQSADEANGK